MAPSHNQDHPDQDADVERDQVLRSVLILLNSMELGNSLRQVVPEENFGEQPRHASGLARLVQGATDDNPGQNYGMMSYFQASGSAASIQSRETALNRTFDNMRNEGQDENNAIGAETSMSYLSGLGANLENASLFVALDLVQASSIGEITRSGFVEGWKATGVDATPQAQQAYFASLVRRLPTDAALFKKVYRHAFVAGKEPNQRSLGLENAMVYWDMLFAPPGQPWVSRASGQDFLAEWKAFLNAKWHRSVNKDMWNQVLEFKIKSEADETLGFWTEDGAWPAVIDEFVQWHRAQNEMDVDA